MEKVCFQDLDISYYKLVIEAIATNLKFFSKFVVFIVSSYNFGIISLLAQDVMIADKKLPKTIWCRTMIVFTTASEIGLVVTRLHYHCEMRK